MKDIELWFGDCLELMNNIPDNYVDLIFADLPYEELECSWDKMIDLDLLWKQYERIITDRGAIVLTASFKFAMKLVNSNPKLFKYEIIWDKVKPSNIFVGKLRPLPKHEYLLIFSKGTIANKSKKLMNYYPIMEDQIERQSKIYSQSDAMFRDSHIGFSAIRKQKYPKSIIIFSNAKQKGKLHPTQKTEELLDWVIRSFSKKNDVVLDNVMGSGTTGFIAKKLNRKFIGIEKEKKYFDISVERICV